MESTELTTWRLRAGLPAAVPGRHGPPRGDLSASKVRLLDTCDLAYSYDHLDKVADRPNDAMLRGNLVHRVLETVGRARVLGDRSGRPSESELREVLREESARFRCSTAVINAAWDIIEALSDRLDFSNTFCVEENFRVDLPQDALAGPPFTLVGAFDRLDRHHDAEAGGMVVHIHDYKSGSNVRSVAELLDDPQVLFYVAAVAEHWTGRIRVTFHYLGAEIPVTFLAPLTLARKGLDLAMTKMAELRGKSEWLPTTGPHCVGCDFRGRCPAYAKMCGVEEAGERERVESFRPGSDEELLREYDRCRTLEKLFDDHKAVVGSALRERLETVDRVIGGGLRAILSPRPKRRLPDDVDTVANALAAVVPNSTADDIAKRISGISERKLRAFVADLHGEVRDAVEQALEDLKEIFDATTALDVRPLAGGF